MSRPQQEAVRRAIQALWPGADAPLAIGAILDYLAATEAGITPAAVLAILEDFHARGAIALGSPGFRDAAPHATGEHFITWVVPDALGEG